MARFEHDRQRSPLRERFRRRSRVNAGAHGRTRKLHLETLEDRKLLAVGPQLIGINTSSIKPDAGQLIVEDQVLDVAPVGLTFRFDANQEIDASSLNGIHITRSNFDGDFDDNDQVVVTPGFAGLGQSSNEVVVRFAETLPDDQYRIEILGSGGDALRNIQGDVFNKLATSHRPLCARHP